MGQGEEGPEAVVAVAEVQGAAAERQVVGGALSGGLTHAERVPSGAAPGSGILLGLAGGPWKSHCFH